MVLHCFWHITNRGCLTQFLGGLDTDWTSFSEAIERLMTLVRNKDGIESVIKNLDGKLSEAIMHAVRITKKYVGHLRLYNYYFFVHLFLDDERTGFREKGESWSEYFKSFSIRTNSKAYKASEMLPNFFSCRFFFLIHNHQSERDFHFIEHRKEFWLRCRGVYYPMWPHAIMQGRARWRKSLISVF